MIKLGLVGAGRWGKNYIRIIEALDNVHLHRLASRNLDSINLVNNKCIVTSDWQTLIEKNDLDGLVLSVPPDIQFKIAVAALQKGLPLLLEKPLAVKVTDAEYLVELANKNNVPVLVDHIYLFHPAYRKIKSIINKSENISSIASRRGKWGPFRENISPLWDWAPHDIAMCIDLIDTYPSKIDASVIARKKIEDDIGENLRINLTFDKNIEAKITIGNIFDKPERYISVEYGEKEMIFDDLDKHKLFYQDENCKKEIPVADDMPLSVVVKTFIDGIKSGDKSMFGLEQSLMVVKIIADIENVLNTSM